MQRMKFYLSGMMTVLMAALMCVSMSACGGSGSDDDFDGIDIDKDVSEREGHSVTRGEWQLDISFSGDTSGWDLEIMFKSTTPSAENYPMFEGDKELELNAWDSYWKSQDFRDYAVRTGKKGYTIHCSIKLKRKKNVEANPVTIKVKSSVNGDKQWEEEFVSDPQFEIYYVNLNSQTIHKAVAYND